MIQSIDEEIYGQIYNEIEPNLPERWTKIALYVAYTGSSFTMKYYTLIDGKYEDCFDTAEKKAITECFKRVDSIVFPQYKQLEKKNKWTVMTLIISSDMSFRTVFDYDDFSEDRIDYFEKWKAKYLIQ